MALFRFGGCVRLYSIFEEVGDISRIYLFYLLGDGVVVFYI